MKNKKNLGYFIVLCAIILITIYIILKPKVVDIEAAKVNLGTFEEIVKSDGRFRSKNKYVVSAFAEGNLSRVDLKVGDRVKKGQKIAELMWDNNLEVTAPISGVISKVFRESAGPILRGEPIVEIINPEKLEIVIELLTTDAVNVTKGNLVKVVNWGGAESLEAVVTKKSRAGFTKISALGVEEERTEIICELKDSSKINLEKLGNNFHIDVNIVVSKTDNVLKVPMGALFKVDNQWAVYRIFNRRAKLTYVEVLKMSFEEAMVGAGLGAGELVVMYPGEQIKNGTIVSFANAP